MKCDVRIRAEMKCGTMENIENDMYEYSKLDRDIRIYAEMACGNIANYENDM